MTTYERNTLLIVGLLLASLYFLPVIPQDQTYHAFADQRIFWGIPNTLNTLSNLGFLMAGLWGLSLLARGFLPMPTVTEKTLTVLFFVGLVVTACGSTWYHLQPNDATLAWDRMGMVITFAGVLGLISTQKVSVRVGILLGVLSLIGGMISIAWWRTHGNLAPYTLLQFGGIALVLGLLMLCARDHRLRWDWLIIAYIAAKIFEALDQPIFSWTLETVSGHTLKHAVAACAAIAFLPLVKSQQIH